jgi:hypothetical protein
LLLHSFGDFAHNGLGVSLAASGSSMRDRIHVRNHFEPIMEHDALMALVFLTFVIIVVVTLMPRAGSHRPRFRR